MPKSRPTHIIRDRDSKFTEQFCSILEADGIEFRPIPARSPHLNPYAESWVGRTKDEVLNHFVVFGEKHLRDMLKSWLEYYHKHRPHQGPGNKLVLGERKAAQNGPKTLRRRAVVAVLPVVLSWLSRIVTNGCEKFSQDGRDRG